MGKVNLTKKIAGKRYCPVVFSQNGSIKPDWVVVSGEPERHPEGAYYIDWTQDGKRCRESVGKSPVQAMTAQRRKEAELKAIEAGIAIVSEDDEEQSKRRKIGATIIDYLDEIKLTKKPKTYSAYSKALEYFQESLAAYTDSQSKRFVDEIDRRDLLRFSAFLRDNKEQAPRSCHNKFENVLTFLKACDRGKLVKAQDWPSYTEETPEIYEPEELDAFLRKCTADELDIFTFYLTTGFREQEVMHVTWNDVNFRLGTVSVKWKPELGWTPKAYKEREVPVNDILLELLAKRPRDKKTPLIFPNTEGNPQRHFIRHCKHVAIRAGFDPDRWWLHKFRATFATLHLQAGTDIRTVQSWLGHSDLASTLRYLRPARNAAVRERVNSTFAFCIK